MINTIQRIPKGINEFLFFAGAFGIVLILKKKNALILVKAFVLATFFMVFWRVIMKVRTSRYFSALIIFYIPFASCFLFLLLSKTKRIFYIFSLCVFSIVIFFQAKKILSFSPISQNMYILADCLSNINKKDPKCFFLGQKKDFNRIKYLSGLRDNFKFDDSINNSLNTFFNPIKEGDNNLSIVLFSNINDSFQIAPINTPNTVIHLLSIFSQKNKKKRLHVFYAQNKATTITTSSQELNEPDNLLKNGDFELLDSIQESSKKIRSRIPNFFIYQDFNDSIRTPQNVFFTNNQKYSKLLPYYTCNSIDPISGKYSAYIRVNKLYGYLFFDQSFKNGIYKLSLLVRGIKGTKICLLYDANINRDFRVIPLTFYTIPDTTTHRISTVFSVNDLSSSDYFIVGVRVYNGVAFFDDFSLKKLNDYSDF